MHYVHKKARCGSEIATFRTKTHHFFGAIRLNWLATIELRGARGPWSSILSWVTAVSEKCWKETETEETTIGVFSEISIGGRGAGSLPPPPFGNDYDPSEENKKGVRKFSARFLAFCNEISTVQKIVLSSSRGQGNFRGLEALRRRPRTWRLRPRTSKCVLEDVLEAKNVLQDSTSSKYNFSPFWHEGRWSSFDLFLVFCDKSLYKKNFYFKSTWFWVKIHHN